MNVHRAQRGIIGGIVTGLLVLWIGPGLAHAGVILPTDPATLKLDTRAGLPTMSIFQLDSTLPTGAPTSASASRCTTTGTNFYRDVTDCWLPAWDPATGVGKEVYVVINGLSASPSPVPPLAPFLTNLTTSAYLGRCTNFGSDSGQDLDLSITPTPLQTATGTVTGFRLTPNDCGGMAVILVNGLKFILPQDGTVTVAANGIPEIWENLYGGNLAPAADIELLGPNPAQGDGLANFDEYRGFVANGIQIRTDPTRKDLFAHVLNPQCPSTGLSLLGQRSGETQTIYPIDGTSVLGGLTSLGGASTTVAYHFLSYQDRMVNGSSNEWTDYLVSYDVAAPDFVFATTPDGSDGRIEDRSINQNAVYQKGVPHPTNPNRLIHKGIRLIECINTSVGAVGVAFFPPGIQEGNPDSDTNSVIYTQRIYADYANLLNRASSRGTTSAYRDCALLPNTTCVYFSTYRNGGWTPGTNTYVDAGGTKNVNRDYIVSKYIQYILAMELGHAVDLIPVLQITTYGPHYAPGTGDNLDQRVVAKDSKTLHGILFQIPSVYGDKSNAGFHLVQP